MCRRVFSPGAWLRLERGQALDQVPCDRYLAAMTDDLIQPFQIDAPGLRGRLVRMGTVADDIISRHAYPEPVARILGEALALAAALAAALKYDGVFTVQTKGDGPIKLMVADVTSDGKVRGYAQFDQDELDQAMAGPIEAPVPRLLGNGYLAFTVDQGSDTERYQGIVELDGATLADCAHHYFRQSEQVEAGIVLSSALDPNGKWRSGAIMLQRVPDEGGVEPTPREQEIADDDWRRSLLIMSTGTATELLDPDLSANDLLFRLFHEDGVRVYDPQNLRAECRCSRDRVSSVLSMLPQTEVEELKVDGEIVVTCEFCNRHYNYSDEDVAALYPADLT